jgi:hypothetical protein
MQKKVSPKKMLTSSLESTGKQDYLESKKNRPLHPGMNQCSYKNKKGKRCIRYCVLNFCFAHNPHKNDQRKIKAIKKAEKKEATKAFKLNKKMAKAPDFISRFFETQNSIEKSIKAICTNQNVGYINQATIRDQAKKGKENYEKFIAILAKNLSEGTTYYTVDASL